MTNMAYWADQEMNDNYPVPGDTWRLAKTNRCAVEVDTVVKVLEVYPALGSAVAEFTGGERVMLPDYDFDVTAGAKLLVPGDLRLAAMAKQNTDEVDVIDAHRANLRTIETALTVHRAVCAASTDVLLLTFVATLEMYSADYTIDAVDLLQDTLCCIFSFDCSGELRSSSLVDVAPSGQAATVWETVRSRHANAQESTAVLDAWARRLSHVHRATNTPEGHSESVLQHSITLAVMTAYTLLQSPRREDPEYIVDAIVSALLHDLPEAWPGCQDTDTLKPLSNAEQFMEDQRERQAAAALYADLTAGGYDHLEELHRRYEAQRDRSVRHIRVLDKVLPKVAGVADACLSLQQRELTYLRLRYYHRTQLNKLQEEYNDCPEALTALALSCARLEQLAMLLLPSGDMN